MKREIIYTFPTVNLYILILPLNKKIKIERLLAPIFVIVFVYL